MLICVCMYVLNFLNSWQPQWQTVFEVSAASHAYSIHMNGAARWQRSRFMLCRPLCVSNFLVGGPPRDLMTTERGSGNANSSSGASHSLRLHSVVLALWQQLGCVCARALCVPKFAVGGCPRELWSTFSHNVPSCWCVCVCRICLQKRETLKG